MDLSLTRRVEPELLDTLAVDDPVAQRSRADLRRLHHVMATLAILRRALDRATADFRPRTLLELGAGDGTLALRLARQRALPWPGVRLTLLDRQPLATPATMAAIAAAGWTPEFLAVDVFDWLTAPTAECPDVIFANLFVHHFAGDALARLLAGVAGRCRAFVCCEPRRSALVLAGSHAIGLLGAGPVTRYDAVASVRAGFQGQELSALWPERDDWDLREYPAGLFSHCLVAVRKER